MYVLTPANMSHIKDKLARVKRKSKKLFWLHFHDNTIILLYVYRYLLWSLRPAFRFSPTLWSPNPFERFCSFLCTILCMKSLSNRLIVITTIITVDQRESRRRNINIYIYIFVYTHYTDKLINTKMKTKY